MVWNMRIPLGWVERRLHDAWSWFLGEPVGEPSMRGSLALRIA